MSLETDETVVLDAPFQQRSLLAVGRLVKSAIHLIEIMTGYNVPPRDKRMMLRHELGHHEPLVHRPVRIKAMLHRSAGKLSSRISLTHRNATAFEELRSATRPLSDRRFHQTLSIDDEVTIKEATRRLR